MLTKGRVYQGMYRFISAPSIPVYRQRVALPRNPNTQLYVNPARSTQLSDYTDSFAQALQAMATNSRLLQWSVSKNGWYAPWQGRLLVDNGIITGLLEGVNHIDQVGRNTWQFYANLAHGIDATGKNINFNLTDRETRGKESISQHDDQSTRSSTYKRSDEDLGWQAYLEEQRIVHIPTYQPIPTRYNAISSSAWTPDLYPDETAGDEELARRLQAEEQRHPTLLATNIQYSTWYEPSHTSPIAPKFVGGDDIDAFAEYLFKVIDMQKIRPENLKPMGDRPLETLKNSLETMGPEKIAFLKKLSTDPSLSMSFRTFWSYSPMALIGVIMDIPDGQTESVLKWLKRFIKAEEGSLFVEDLITAIVAIPFAQRDTIFQHFEGFHPNSTEVGQILKIIQAIPENECIQRVQNAEAQYKQDPNNAEMNALGNYAWKSEYIKALLNTPTGKDFPRSIDFKYTGQEVLSGSRQFMREAYNALATNKKTGPLIQDRLPSSPEEADRAFPEIAATIHAWVATRLGENIPEPQKIRLNIADQGLQLLEGKTEVKKYSGSEYEDYQTYPIKIVKTPDASTTYMYNADGKPVETDHNYIGMPNIRQLFVLGYRLIEHEAKKDGLNKLLTTFLVKNWDKIKTENAKNTKTPAFFQQNTVGEAIQSDTNFFLKILEAGLDEETEKFNGLTPRLLGALKQDLNENKDATIAAATDFTPLTEALFTIMRGHQAGKMDEETAENQPACAEGAYMQILETIPIILHDEASMSLLAKLDIKTCA